MTHDPIAPYLDDFARLADRLPGPMLRRAREAALAHFAAAGFPGRRDEAWRYTSVSGLAGQRFLPADGPLPADLTLPAFAPPLPDCHLMLFADGRAVPDLGRRCPMPDGAILAPLADALADPAIADTLLATRPAHVFADLNLAFFRDGAHLYLPPDARLGEPVHLVFLAQMPGAARQTRNLIVLARGSRASVVEHHLGPSYLPGFSNHVVDIRLDEGAQLTYYLVQEESAGCFHLSAVNVAQAADSRLQGGVFGLGGHLARVDLSIDLAGARAECDLLGLALAEGRQHLDAHVHVDHRAPQTVSRQLFKAIAAGQGHSVFDGRVVVHPGAPGSDAQQATHNLLLSPMAEIDAKPQLDILTDDVQCSHGATVGPLDEEQVFYLRARGLDNAEARQLLTRAFALDALAHVRLPSLRGQLESAAQTRLAALDGRP